MNKFVALLTAVLLGSGCAVGPNYKRPVVSVPDSYRGLTPEEAEKKQVASIGDQKWWDIFQDEQLRSLIRTALQQNYDARIAASRILAARAQLGITRADQFPTVSAGAGISDNRSAKSKFIPAFEESTGHVEASAAWELDFWGKYRRATEAARANLLATEWARQEVLATLVANVSSAYFLLRALDLELEISKRTLGSRQESLRLTQTLADRGATSLLDVRQAEQLVFTAAAEVPALEQQIEQEENFISSLLGKNPGDVPRGQKLTEQAQPPEVPEGLTSSLLERRPDIREAEQQLIAANAQIGVARAAYFPQISLSGSGGFQSAALTSLFTGPAGLEFRGRPGATDLHRRKASFQCPAGRSAAASRIAFLPANHSRRLPQRFRRVDRSSKDAGIPRSRGITIPVRPGCCVPFPLALQRGGTGYLEVLTNETNSFSAELALVQARLNELLALVQLYEALGGGWQQ